MRDKGGKEQDRGGSGKDRTQKDGEEKERDKYKPSSKKGDLTEKIAKMEISEKKKTETSSELVGHEKGDTNSKGESDVKVSEQLNTDKDSLSGDKNSDRDSRSREKDEPEEERSGSMEKSLGERKGSVDSIKSAGSEGDGQDQRGGRRVRYRVSCNSRVNSLRQCPKVN